MERFWINCGRDRGLGIEPTKNLGVVPGCRYEKIALVSPVVAPVAWLEVVHHMGTEGMGVWRLR